MLQPGSTKPSLLPCMASPTLPTFCCWQVLPEGALSVQPLSEEEEEAEAEAEAEAPASCISCPMVTTCAPVPLSKFSIGRTAPAAGGPRGRAAAAGRQAGRGLHGH